jgi:acid phosphatase family membrane protein YuiD
MTRPQDQRSNPRNAGNGRLTAGTEDRQGHPPWARSLKNNGMPSSGPSIFAASSTAAAVRAGSAKATLGTAAQNPLAAALMMAAPGVQQHFLQARFVEGATQALQQQLRQQAIQNQLQQQCQASFQNSGAVQGLLLNQLAHQLRAQVQAKPSTASAAAKSKPATASPSVVYNVAPSDRMQGADAMEIAASSQEKEPEESAPSVTESSANESVRYLPCLARNMPSDHKKEVRETII